jgi:hypothetical protein
MGITKEGIEIDRGLIPWDNQGGYTALLGFDLEELDILSEDLKLKLVLQNPTFIGRWRN